MTRVTRYLGDVIGLLGVALLGAGAWGLGGWPWAALLLGVLAAGGWIVAELKGRA